MAENMGLTPEQSSRILSKLKSLVNSRKKMAALIVILIVAGYLGWRRFSSQEQTPQYQTATVEKGTIVSSITASGNVLVSNIQKINTQASGMVKKVYVQNGDQVKQGQTLVDVQLDTQGAQSQAQAYASYLSAKSSLESAKATEYTLNSSMWVANQKFINDALDRGLADTDPTYIEESSDWLAAEAKYKNQQQVVAQAQVSLNNAWLSYQSTRATITAPVAGTVTGLSVAEGMQIGSTDSSTGNRLSQQVAAISIGGTPLISLNVNEIDVPRVESGQKVTLTLDSIPDSTFTGQVASVDKLGSISSGVTSYPVVVKLDTNAPQILPNMSVSGNIIVASKSDVLIVPSGAVQEQNGQSYVRVLNNGQVTNAPVETGLTSDTQTEIVSGVTEGEQVVTNISSSTQNGQSPFGGGGFGGGFRVLR